MNETTETREELERACQAWAALSPEDGAARLSMQGEIFELVYRLFPEPENADEINTVFMTDWQSFDPAKGSAYGFFSSRIHLRKKDRQRRERIWQSRKVWEADPEVNRALDRIPAGPEGGPEEGLTLDATACELICAILELPQRLQGRANNAVRHNYFRMFFTDNVATYLHDSPPPEAFRRREGDLFAAIKREFLDYFMAERCQSVDAICHSALKPYGALVEGREMEETRLPLPGDVYVSYLDRVENTKVNTSAVSQQRTFYRREVEKWLR